MTIVVGSRLGPLANRGSSGVTAGARQLPDARDGLRNTAEEGRRPGWSKNSLRVDLLISSKLL